MEEEINKSEGLTVAAFDKNWNRVLQHEKTGKLLTAIDNDHQEIHIFSTTLRQFHSVTRPEALINISGKKGLLFSGTFAQLEERLMQNKQ